MLYFNSNLGATLLGRGSSEEEIDQVLTRQRHEVSNRTVLSQNDGALLNLLARLRSMFDGVAQLDESLVSR